MWTEAPEDAGPAFAPSREREYDPGHWGHSLRMIVSAGLCRGSGGNAGGGGSLTCYKICFPLKGINVFLDQRPRGQVPCQCSLV